jgi:hypothetical protein
MADRREALSDAAFAIVREGGCPALIQVRVAVAAGMAHGHLARCFPTRTDLVREVAR